MQNEEPTEASPPRIICPVIRAMVHENSLDVDTESHSDVTQLGAYLKNLRMPFFSHWVAFFANRPTNILTNILRGVFLPLKMHQGLIKHTSGTRILTAGETGVFNKARFEKMIAAGDGERMTADDFLNYNKTLQNEPGSTSAGAWLNRLEFSILLRFFGSIDKTGTRYLSSEDLRALYEDAKLPPHKHAVVTGRVARKEVGENRYLPGLNVELHQRHWFRSKLLAVTQTSGTDGAFRLEAGLNTNGLRLQVRFIDPRPSMNRDREFYAIDCPERGNGECDLGLVRVPHWQYDTDFPFPIAMKNLFSGKVPQRFTAEMSKAFRWATIIQFLKTILVIALSPFLSLKTAHRFFPAPSEQKLLQEEDSDDYFMYRILNGFYPSPVYVRSTDDPLFTEAKYFVDCNFDKYQSDGAHNLISGRLYFNVESDDEQPTPCGIHLRIRHADDTDASSCRVSELSVSCDNSPQWTMAKRAFRSSWATAGELDAHLATGHLNVGQYAIAAYRNFFSSPLRELLLPFLKGVTEINEKGKNAIFGESGVLSKNTPLTRKAIWARLGNHLGTLDWHNWAPPRPLYKGHVYAHAADIYWRLVNQHVEEFFAENADEIEVQFAEVRQFSNDIVGNCVSLYQHNQLRPASGSEDHAGENKDKRVLTEHQKHYQALRKGLDDPEASEEHLEQETNPLALHEIVNRDDIKHCCKYIIFHATFWHWWSNDLQATDLSNIVYTSLGLRNGALEPTPETLPPVHIAVRQLAFASLLTDVHVGKIQDQEPGRPMARLWELLTEERESFQALENQFELDSTFNVENIRSRINI